jgi:predicted RNase H-like HicB family nuclease
LPDCNAAFFGQNIRMKLKLSAIIEKDEQGYFAYCPELKGCHTQGDTFEEALANLQEAAELYVETLSPEELKATSSKTILSTSLEVACA